jgi:hypothetical protein
VAATWPTACLVSYFKSSSVYVFSGIWNRKCFAGSKRTRSFRDSSPFSDSLGAPCSWVGYSTRSEVKVVEAILDVTSNARSEAKDKRSMAVCRRRDFFVRWILSTATKLFERVCSDRSARRREPLQVHASETNPDQPCSTSKEPRKVNGLGLRKLHRPLAGTFEDRCLTIGESELSATLTVNLSRDERYPALRVDSSPRPPQAVDH